MTKARDIATSEVVTGEIGDTIQAHDDDLDSIAALDKTDGNVIVSDGANWVAESGATARTSLGLGAMATKSSVATADIDNDAVTEVKIQSGAVTTSKIGTQAVTQVKIADNSVSTAKVQDNAINASKLNVPGNGTSGQFLSTDGDGTFSWGDAGGGGGGLKSQRFNTPGTWTKPSTTSSVKVTVVGGGAGGPNGNANSSSSPGGTSTFGGKVTATGGIGISRNYPTVNNGPPGTASYTVGDPILIAPGFPGQFSAINTPSTGNTVLQHQFHIGGQITGWVAAPSSPSYALINATASNGYLAGLGGYNPSISYASGGSGGRAIVGSVPVTGPVAVTVGAGSARGPGPSAGVAGVGGVVLVEWIEE